MTESLFNRVAVLIAATLLKERPRQVDFSVNFARFSKTLFKELLWVVASAQCKHFVILQLLAKFNKSSFIIPSLYLLLCNPSFVILAFLVLLIVLKPTLNIRTFPKNTAHKKLPEKLPG